MGGLKVGSVKFIIFSITISVIRIVKVFLNEVQDVKIFKEVLKNPFSESIPEFF